MSELLRIGEALVAQGEITSEQLAEALKVQKEAEGTPLGLVLTERFGVAARVVDLANVQSVLLPRFRKLLMTRLLSISRGDKFAKGLDVVDFVTSIATVAESFEVGVYTSRRYSLDGEDYHLASSDLGFVTRMDVRVAVVTRNGDKVTGALNVSHDSRDDRLVITDDETRVKETIYYGLRTAFRSKG